MPQLLVLFYFLLKLTRFMFCLYFLQDPAASSTSEAEPDAKGETVAMNYKPSPLQVQIGSATRTLRINTAPEWRQCFAAPPQNVETGTNLLLSKAAHILYCRILTSAAVASRSPAWRLIPGVRAVRTFVSCFCLYQHKPFVTRFFFNFYCSFILRAVFYKSSL